jgi:hypothetical protein
MLRKERMYSRSINIYYIFFRMQGITPETAGYKTAMPIRKKSPAPPMLRATNIQDCLPKTPKHHSHATASCSEQCFSSTH